MKKLLALFGMVLLMSMSSNVFAQTLLYEASGIGDTFGKTGGSENYEISLGDNPVEDGKLVITAGNSAANIVINPTISGYAGGGLTVLMKVSNVDVTRGGQFIALGAENATMLGGIKIKSGTTDGLLHTTWGTAEWTGAINANYPTDASTAVVGYAYIRSGEDGGVGSAFYLNGTHVATHGGLVGSQAIGNVTLGGVSRSATTFLNVGMKIEMVRIFAGQLDADQMQTATSNMIGDAFDAELISDGNGTVEFVGENGDDIMFGVPAMTQLRILATPEEGYIFDKWVDAENDTLVITTANPHTFHISSNVFYKALFLEYTEKTVTVYAGENGTTDKTGVNNVVLTDNFTVTATANPGYVFDKWVDANDEVISTVNPYTYTGREDFALKATFKIGVVSASVTPVADDGKWYFVQSQRYQTDAENPGAWWTLGAEGDSVYVVPSAQTKEENQLFTLVSAPDGRVTFKSFDGRIMTRTGAFVAGGETDSTWVLTPNTINEMQGFLFPGVNYGLHQGGVSWDWEVRGIGWYSETDNCTFFFYAPNAETELRTLYNEAFQLYESAYVSNNPGNYGSLEGKVALYAALELAATKFGGSDEEIDAAMVDLQVAMDDFRSQKIELIASTADAPVWYLIKNFGAAYSKNKVLYTTGEGTQCKWGDVAPINEDKLFRFEAHPTEVGQYRIINAANPEGQLNGDSYGAYEEPVYFRVVEVSTTEGAKFQLISTAVTSGSSQLHAQSNGSLLVLWNSSDYETGASVWQFDRYYEDMNLVALLDVAESWANGAIVDGSAGNHKNQADVDALKEAIEAAKVYVGSDDVEQLALAVEALQAAMDEFEAVANVLETSTASSPIYYLILNAMTNGYSTDKALYTVDAESQLLWETPEPLTDHKFFFFEAHASNANQYRIINAAYPDGELVGTSYGPASNIYFDLVSHRGAEGAKFQIIDNGQHLHAAASGASLVYWQNNDYSSASMWKFVKLTDYLADRYEELVAEMATLIDEEGNPIGFELGEEDGNYGQVEFDTMVDAYYAMVADYNSGGISLHVTISDLTAAILEFRASLVITDSIGDATTTTIKVSVVNGTIVAEGTEAPVQVYTISGARKQNRNLESGVYVGRVAGTTFKVLVK